MRAKVGLASSEDDDAALINDMYAAMEGQAVDYTLFFRRLADAALGHDEALLALFDDVEKIKPWVTAWKNRLLRDPQNPDERAKAMNTVNPVYIPRNHLVEAALTAGTAGDLAPFEELSAVLADPFTERAGLEHFANPAPQDFTSGYQTFCGT